MQCSLSIEIKSRFSYSHEVLERFLISPLDTTFIFPRFAGISSLDDSISPANIERLNKLYIGDFSPTITLAKLENLQQGGVAKSRKNEHEAAYDIFGMSIAYAKMVWRCHLLRLQQHSTPHLQMILWQMTLESFANRALIALKIAEQNPIYFEAARQVTEEGIEYLVRNVPFPGGEMHMEETHTVIEKRKAKLSFRAHLACVGMGDRDAAVEYLGECLKLDPESGKKLRERITELQAEKQQIIRKKAVSWERTVMDKCSDEKANLS
jgi:hypothetical protein